VSYQRYQDYVGFDLPEKMTLSNERLRIKMVVSDWRLDVP
jgi:outer membrane biogenesis lipoprotein LolB